MRGWRRVSRSAFLAWLLPTNLAGRGNTRPQRRGWILILLGCVGPILHRELGSGSPLVPAQSSLLPLMLLCPGKAQAGGRHKKI